MGYRHRKPYGNCDCDEHYETLSFRQWAATKKFDEVILAEVQDDVYADLFERYRKFYAAIQRASKRSRKSTTRNLPEARESRANGLG